MTRILSTTLIAAASLGLAAAAHAQDSEPFAFDFQYDRDAVQTEAGAIEVYEALEAEIAAHCETDAGGNAMLNRRLQQACTEQTLDDAIELFRSPALVAAHDQQSQG